LLFVQDVAGLMIELEEVADHDCRMSLRIEAWLRTRSPMNAHERG